ncbi:MAG: hypothetical protein K2R98_30945 [Gemmataceae bacterium]|nr:hypothetical protein [Gemmataceae bacterium]
MSTDRNAGGESPDDREVIRLAKARLTRVCRLDAASAEQALRRAAVGQKAALVSIAMRVLSASPEDLAAGKVLADVRAPEPRRREQRGPRPADPRARRGPMPKRPSGRGRRGK